MVRTSGKLALRHAWLGLTALLALTASWHAAPAGSQPAWFVDGTAAAGGDGTSWAQAFQTIEPALAKTDGLEIWVAEGTYTPKLPALAFLARTATFKLGPGDRLFGGFDGDETARDQREPIGNVTTLSGDIPPTGTSDRAF